jgi:hypothetical protein
VEGVAPPGQAVEGVDDHLVSLVAPTAFQAEQYRALRHVLEQARRTTGVQVVAVSSPGGGDGKTMRTCGSRRSRIGSRSGNPPGPDSSRRSSIHGSASRRW